MRPSGFMATPRSAARSESGSSSAGANGAPVSPSGDSPSARWCIAVLPTITMSYRCCAEISWRAQSVASTSLMPSAARRVSSSSAVFVKSFGDPRDHILAVAHLRILDGLLVDQVAFLKVHEVDDDLGRADVDGGPIGAQADVLGLDVDEASFVHRGGDREAAVTQGPQEACEAPTEAERWRPAPPAHAGGRCARPRTWRAAAWQLACPPRTGPRRA